MNVEEFKATLKEKYPDPEWNIQIQALWFDGRGEWKKAHDLVDHLNDRKSAHIHAYLHRVEGDLWNARYWYNRAEENEFNGSLEDEWEFLVSKYFN